MQYVDIEHSMLLCANKLLYPQCFHVTSQEQSSFANYQPYKFDKRTTEIVPLKIINRADLMNTGPEHHCILCMQEDAASI